jgi:FolB domain-containing protein
VLINILLWVDGRRAAQSDRIEDAVNYRDITKQVIAHVEASEYFLIERLAEQVARICLQDPRVQETQVMLEKPGALRFARSVGVTIRRTRADLNGGLPA